VKRAAALLVAAVLVLGSAGCGGAGGGRLSKSQYEAKMQSLARGLASTERKLRTFAPADFSAVTVAFGQLADTFEAYDEQLSSFKPPRDVQALQNRIVAGVGQAAKELRTFASKLSGANRQQIQRLLREFDSSKLQGALREIELAAAAIAAKGYRIGASAGT
jgi:hypothetical protein